MGEQNYRIKGWRGEKKKDLRLVRGIGGRLKGVTERILEGTG